jgi:hypothetical protein
VVKNGRRFLYDARKSGHGDSACASCHVFGDFDSLAWDLGDPFGSVATNFNPFRVGGGGTKTFHPLKGPMTTQSLRGMADAGPMHWRGDRTGGNDAPSFQPDSGTFDEDAAFKKFNVAFPGLLGRSAEIPAADMQAFTDFILQIVYPPNPIRNLDNSFTPDQQAGRDFFFDNKSGFVGMTCEQCHTVDRNGNAEFGVTRPGFFGSSGEYTLEAAPQVLKVPHLRNEYQKIGMFGVAFLQTLGGVGTHDSMGDQVRGFGFLHDGSVDNRFSFNLANTFDATAENPGGFPVVDGDRRTPEADRQRRQVEAYVLAFDSNLAPIVGQQTTLGSSNAAVAGPRLDLLRARADAGECDLVVKGVVAGFELGFLYLRLSGGMYLGSGPQLLPISETGLRALAQQTPLTFTCAPPGSGQRIALDRDEDGFRDGAELLAGTDPADPASHP